MPRPLQPRLARDPARFLQAAFGLVGGAVLLAGAACGGPVTEKAGDELSRAAAEQARPTRVYLLRHAEKQSGEDPLLTEQGEVRAAALAGQLENEPVAHIFASEFRRTQETVRQLADALELDIETVPAAESRELVRRIADHAGETMVVCGHSNTVPEIAEALGLEEKLVLADGDYGDLFLLELADPVRLIRLRFGDPEPSG